MQAKRDTEFYIFIYNKQKQNGLSAKEERKKKSTQTTAFNYTVYEQEEEQQNLKSYKKQRAKHWIKSCMSTKHNRLDILGYLAVILIHKIKSS